MKALFLAAILALCGQSWGQTDNVLCTKDYCQAVIDQNPCPDLPENCKIMNTTHSGTFLPSPEICNCCDFCLENINEGEPCTGGEIGGIIPASMCGPGLACDATESVCKRMTTGCTAAQDEYDAKRAAGTLGILEVKPECDGNGDFEPYKCIPGQTCFCVDKKGERIFGEIPFTDIPSFALKCKCARNYAAALGVIGTESLAPNQFFRCKENGDYDILQCASDKDCFCTDAEDGALTFPEDRSVKITDISNKTLRCLQDTDYEFKDGEYYKGCALEYVNDLKEIDESQDTGDFDLVLNIRFPSCTVDGNYHPIQKTSTEQYCADPSGKKLGAFSIDVTDLAATAEMDCKCARTRYVMTSSGSTKELPECCQNGNFKKLQCRRDSCFCVDRDGYQSVQEVPREDQNTLSCFENACVFP